MPKLVVLRRSKPPAPERTPMPDEEPKSPISAKPSNPPNSARKPPKKDDTVAMLLRVAQRFMVPFVLSFLLAFIGSQLNLMWLYFGGLIGVGVSMLGLLVWLIS